MINYWDEYLNNILCYSQLLQGINEQRFISIKRKLMLSLNGFQIETAEEKSVEFVLNLKFVH